MKRILCKVAAILLVTLVGSQISFAQKNQDSVLLNIAGEKYTVSQLLDSYGKTNPNPAATFNKADFEDYIQLFINYKLKIKEAEELRLDTMQKFKDEYSMYYYQVTNKYLIDDSCVNVLAKMCYEHLKTNVRASHILLKIEEGDSDTAMVYKKAMDIRKKALKGESFEKLAIEYSEDLSATDHKDAKTGENIKGNGGDLGYFTAFEMASPVEDAVYKMAIGEISMPIRTSFGYHIVKKTGSLPSWGKTKLKHIWVKVDEKGDTTKAYSKITTAYGELKKGRAFAEVAKNYSEDDSAVKGGALPSLDPSQMPADYLEKAATIKEGTFTNPFKTEYGYHIIFLEEKLGVSPFSEVESTFRRNILTGDRSTVVSDSFMQKVGKEYGFKEYVKELGAVRKLVGDTINNLQSNNWDYPKTMDLSKIIFILDGKQYTQRDFADYIKKMQKIKMTLKSMDYYFDMKYKSFLLESCIAVEKSHLEEKYPDIKQALQNYKEGLLIFDINEKMVWMKSIVDTTGLEKFYNDTKNSHLVKLTPSSTLSEEDSYYMWNDRADVTIWKFQNNCIAQDKAIDIMKKGLKKQLADSEIFDMLKAKINKSADATKDIQYTWGVYEKTEIEDFNKLEWKEGVSNAISGKDSYEIFFIHKIIPAELKSLDEAKGYYTNNYQDYLEKEWIKSLRAKYPYSINTQLLSTIR